MSMPESTPGMLTAARPSGRLLGIALAALAAVFASSAGVLLRHIESADAWTVLFYRSLSFTVTVLIFTIVCHRGTTLMRFRQIGVPGMAVALSLGGAFLAFVLALVQANVASVVAVLSISPMLAGFLGWMLLGERPSGLGWLAMIVAFGGVSVVVWDRLASGAEQGLLFAVLACLGYAAAIVGLRVGRRRDMTPAVCLSGVVACAITLAVGSNLSISQPDLTVALLLGAMQIGAQYILLTIATRFASAADIALVMILEVVLAPLWVWLLVGETVPKLALAGGGVILLALLLNALAPEARVNKP